MTKSRGIIVGRKAWSADDDETLRLNWPRFSALLIAYVLKRSPASIYRRAHLLRLKKPDDFYTQPLASLWNGTEHPASIAARYKRGVVPANKGLRRPGFATGRMKETQFKRGRPASEASNYVPIGTEKADRKRKVLMRKITDDPSIFSAHRWWPVHVLVWEAARGAIPPGHIVRFRDGMKTFDPELITVDRLELVTFAENMARNTIHNYPEPIKHAMQLRGALNRRINKLAKVQEQR